MTTGRYSYLQIWLISKQIRFQASQFVAGQSQRFETTKISKDEGVESAKSVFGERKATKQSKAAERFGRHAADVRPGKVQRQQSLQSVEHSTADSSEIVALKVQLQNLIDRTAERCYTWNPNSDYQ